MTDERKEFGKKLIEIRERKGLRQADVVEITGISQRTIGRLERGEIFNPSVDSLIELSKAYGVDIISLNKKYVHGDYYILEEINRSLNLNIIFSSDEMILNLLDKINLIKESRDLKSRKYELKLLEIFIKYISNEINDRDLYDEFEYISSDKIDWKNFPNIDLSPIELRILLNIATTFESYKNIDRLDIFNKCKNQENDKIIKIASCNNLSNFYIKNKDYSKAIKITNEGINYSREKSFIYGLLYLNFSKFLASYRLYDNYEQSLAVTKILLENIVNKNLVNKVNEKIKYILDWVKKLGIWLFLVF